MATIGAVSYPGYEELTVFAAGGAVTERIRFVSNVLLAPARSAAELAKQAATVDQLTNGRLTLGLAIGWRTSDFELVDRDYKTRGKRFEQQLRDLQKAWAGEPMLPGTRAVGPPDGAKARRSHPGRRHERCDPRRVAEFGDGWTAGGLPPDAVAGLVEKVQAAWKDAGRQGRPKIMALAYFGLGGVEQASRDYLLDYYEPMGDEMAQMIAGSALQSADAVKGAVQAFEAVEVDEFILDPTTSDPDQVDKLAEVVF